MGWLGDILTAVGRTFLPPRFYATLRQTHNYTHPPGCPLSLSLTHTQTHTHTHAHAHTHAHLLTPTQVPESLARTLGAAAEALDGLRRRSHWHWVDLGKLFGSLAAPAAAAAAGGAAAGGKGSRQGTAGVGAGMGMGGGVGAVNLGAVRGVVV